MNGLSVFIIDLIALAFSASLWIRLIKVLDQNGIIYTPTFKKMILWTILFQMVRLIVLLSVVHWELLLLQQ